MSVYYKMMNQNLLLQITVLVFILCIIVVYMTLSRVKPCGVQMTEMDNIKAVSVPVKSNLQSCLTTKALSVPLSWSHTVDHCPLGNYKQCTNNIQYQLDPYDSFCPVKPERDRLCNPAVSVKQLHKKLT